MDPAPITPPTTPPGPPAAPAPRHAAKGAAEFGFWDLLDIINPLQHIPVVSTIYRAITGDELKGTARILGGVLFGGPIGGAFAVFNAIFADATGRDLGDHALAMAFGGEWEPGHERPALAAASAPDLPFVAAPASQAAAAPADAPVPAGELLFTPPPALAANTQAPNAQAGGANLAATSATPAWITQAMAQAQEVHDGGTVRVAAQPWFADAMLHALDKYADLAKERADGGREDDRDR